MSAGYSPSQLNFFKFASIVIDEFPNAIRKVFKTMWDTKCPGPPWDDSVAVRNLLSALERHTPKIPTGKSYKEWDCTALFQATIQASTFKDPATGQTLYNKYLKSSIPPLGSFRPTVISPTDDQDETFALAIDQLRLLRNALLHSCRTDVLDNAKFQEYIKYATMAFAALHCDTREIDRISKLPDDEAHIDIPKLEKRVLEERNADDDKTRFNNILPSKTVIFIIAIVIAIAMAIILEIPIAINLIVAIKTRLPNGKTDEKINSAVPGWMNTSNPVFIGRHWLFEQLEDLFRKNDSLNGVLLVGDPGSGKTTIMKQLVNSRINSSRFIHENIVAYHFCEYDRETTRDGGKFVKSLVEQLSRNVPGFEKFIQSQEIQKNLHECKNQPVECSRVAVLEPLHALKISPKTKKFILIDALDECHDKKESYNNIIEILHFQKIRLPSWIKLLMSSRNEISITSKMTEIGVETIAIIAKSKDNLGDIRSFALEIISRYNFTKRNGESMKEKLTESMENILYKTDGNFLFIQKLLEDWGTDPDRINLTSIPSGMKNVYAWSFRERFGKNELKCFAKFFEVILALKLPPKLQFLKRIFTVNDKIDDTEFDAVVDKLRTYLRLNDSVVRIFHHSFAEWLTNHDKLIDNFSIKKSRGHQYIANYHFNHYNQPESELTVEQLYELSMHVLDGGLLEEHVRKLKGLNNSVTNQFGDCILHYLARNRESTEVLKVVIEQFKSVDIFNYRGLTPAYYATIKENYHNLELFITSGIDLNYVPRVPNYCLISPFFYRNMIQADMKYHSLTFIAAYEGNRKIVELLMNNGAHFDEEDKCGWKPLHAAVKGGHLDVVELLIKKTDRTSSDFFALYQAVVCNHSDILTFLLESGARDKCIPCKRDYKDDSMFNLTTRPANTLKQFVGAY